MTSPFHFLQKLFRVQARGGDPSSSAIELSLNGFDIIYAVGDVHGCLEHLKGLEKQIETDAVKSEGRKAAILYLGDLVDRGPKSAHVLDHVTAHHSHLPRLALRGNHEELFLQFFDKPLDHLDWLDFGGLETLNSYSIYRSRRSFESARSSELRVLLDASIPTAHLDFLRTLPHFAQSGDFLFCHAGVDPTRPLEAQTAEDYMWARKRFLSHVGSYDMRIVHGHTPQQVASEEEGRIGLDTGAYVSGTLSCARVDLSYQTVSFMSFHSGDELVHGF